MRAYVSSRQRYSTAWARSGRPQSSPPLASCKHSQRQSQLLPILLPPDSMESPPDNRLGTSHRTGGSGVMERVRASMGSNFVKSISPFRLFDWMRRARPQRPQTGPQNGLGPGAGENVRTACQAPHRANTGRTAARDALRRGRVRSRRPGRRVARRSPPHSGSR